MNQSTTAVKPVEAGTVAIFVTGLLVATMLIQNETGLRQAILFLIGIGLGISLLHAMFGFTGAWRKFIKRGHSDGVRANILLLMLTSLLFFPLLGGVWPQLAVTGAVSPVGYAVLVGAFIFGIGMQLGGGCGSGTLFTMGQGQADMLVTLLFFIIGATVASSHLDWWFALGDIGSISLIKEYGWFAGLSMTWAGLIVLYVIVAFIDKQKHQQLAPVFKPVSRDKIIPTLIYGGWPLWWAVMAIAVFNLLTLLIAGHPWSITFAFSLWGTKIWSAVGGDISQWQYWSLAYPSQALNSSVLLDTTSIMDFGLIIGAGLAATLAGRFAPQTTFNNRKIIAVVVGGFMLGYGARLAFGCNIGALLAGISSGSLHGWLWLIAGFIGNVIGVKARVWLGLEKA